MEHLFLHCNKRISIFERSLLFRVTRLYREQKLIVGYIKYVLYYWKVHRMFLDFRLLLKKLSEMAGMS